jgi:Glycosyltransferase Family 4
MTKRLTVLLTNLAFAFRSGTEIVVDQVARGLSRRDHRPIVFSPHVDGDLAAGLRRNGIAVVDRLDRVALRPDIIHAQHNVTTVMALAAFPGVPALFTCHDFDAPTDRPPLLPRIRRYVAVDESCRERLIRDGVAEHRIEVLYNAVDLDQLHRRPPLPTRPQRALVLTKGAEHLAIVRSAATKAGLKLDELGSGTGMVVDDLPARLPAYDVVIATARMAKEAMAVGCAVVVCDHRGHAGLVTGDVAAEWRRHNFGRRILRHPVTEHNLLRAFAAYDPDDAARVTDLIRGQDNLEGQIDALERIYVAILEEAAVDPAVDLQALAPFLEDYLVSRDFSRPWAELVRSVTREAADVLDLALQRHSDTLRKAIAQMVASPLDRVRSVAIDLADGLTHGDAERHFDRALAFTTPRQQWGYAVTIPCPQISVPCVVEIEVEITAGTAGFGLNDAPLEHYLTEEITVTAAEGRRHIRIAVNRPVAGMVLVIRNVGAGDERSHGIIHRAQVLFATPA